MPEGYSNMTNFNFKKKYGQNFLTDKNLLNAIATDADIKESDTVLEIGAGAGALTKVLSERAKKVIAYEIDKDLKEILTKLYLTNVTFVFEDFLDADIGEFEKNLKEYKVVANLPYYITTPIIFKFLEESEKVISLTIMVQKEVAERIVAKEGGKTYGLLTVMINFYGSAKINRIVNRQMFYPEPNVDSAVITIKIDRDKFCDINSKNFLKFIKTCFSMRRKTLLNNLSEIYSKELLKGTFNTEFLSRRAETLSLDEFIDAFRKLQ